MNVKLTGQKNPLNAKEESNDAKSVPTPPTVADAPRE
jgi:hypothetical protein